MTTEARCICNVATGPHFVRGQVRLRQTIARFAPGIAGFYFTDRLPPGSPSHQSDPYAFKVFALKYAKELGFRQLLWLDSAMIVVDQLDRIWAHAAAHGLWFSRNGYRNSEWTANSAYPILFPGVPIEEARRINNGIEHIVGGAFAVDLDHENGQSFMQLSEQFALSGAFRGPWSGGEGIQHRHDQTVSSVIVHNLRVPITNPPDFLAYPPGGAGAILIADGGHSIAI